VNGQAARELRRDIRRAMGPVALGTLDEHANAIAALHARLDVLLAHTEQRVIELQRQVQQLQDTPVLTRLSRWERLRWLWSGR